MPCLVMRRTSPGFSAEGDRVSGQSIVLQARRRLAFLRQAVWGEPVRNSMERIVLVKHPLAVGTIPLPVSGQLIRNDSQRSRQPVSAWLQKMVNRQAEASKAERNPKESNADREKERLPLAFRSPDVSRSNRHPGLDCSTRLRCRSRPTKNLREMACDANPAPFSLWLEGRGMADELCE